MKTYVSFNKDDSIESLVDATCIGAFDGVHKGHVELIKKTKEISENFQIVTFNVIPKIYFDKQLKPLLSSKQRSDIFKKYDPVNLVYLKFEEINQISPTEFLNLLKNNLKTQKIVVGRDFKFGKNRKGDIRTLKNFFGSNNVIIIDDFYVKNDKVSSTKIRNYLNEGNIEKVNLLLGREYEISGKVVKGLRLGSKLGFPTANIKFKHDFYYPKLGVYEIECELNNEIHKGITNIGYTPTVADRKVLKVEAHLFNFDRDIYGKEIKIRLKSFIRDEIKFDSLDELINQIKKDIDSIKNK